MLIYPDESSLQVVELCVCSEAKVHIRGHKQKSKSNFTLNAIEHSLKPFFLHKVFIFFTPFFSLLFSLFLQAKFQTKELRDS